MIYNFTLLGYEWQLFVWLLVDLKSLEPHPTIQAVIFFVSLMEMIVLFVLFIFYIPYIYVVYTCKKFHINLRRIIVFTKIHTIGIIVIKFFTGLYQLQIIHVTGNWFTDFPLILLSLLAMQSMGVTFTIYPIIFIERALSIVYMWDYEQKRRTQISTSIIVSVSVVAFNFSAIVGLAFVALHSMTVITGIPAFIATMALFIWSMQKIKSTNTRILKDLSTKNHDYALSARYQAAENIRAFPFIRNLLYFSIISDGVAMVFSMMAVIYTVPGSLESQIFGTIMEVWVVLCCLNYMIAGLVSVREWRERLRFYLLKMISRPSKTSPYANKLIVNKTTETQMYFNYYNSNW